MDSLIIFPSPKWNFTKVEIRSVFVPITTLTCSTVCGTHRYSVHVCWMDEWMDALVQINTQLTFLFLPFHVQKFAFIHKTWFFQSNINSRLMEWLTGQLFFFTSQCCFLKAIKSTSHFLNLTFHYIISAYPEPASFSQSLPPNFGPAI